MLGLNLRLPQSSLATTRLRVREGRGALGLADTLLLIWAAREKRTMLTHDRKTMPKFANQLLIKSEDMAGMIVVSNGLAIGRAIEDLEFLIQYYSQSEIRNRIEHLPL